MGGVVRVKQKIAMERKVMFSDWFMGTCRMFGQCAYYRMSGRLAKNLATGLIVEISTLAGQEEK
jgi:hypothetical protein